MPERLLTAAYCAPFFPESAGFRFQVVTPDAVDRVKTVFGEKIRCIDPREGMEANGYNRGAVRRAPAIPGGADGPAVWAKNGLVRAGRITDDSHSEGYTGWAVQAIRELGFEPIRHGDLIKRRDGCKLRWAVENGKVAFLEPLDDIDREFLEGKFGVHYTEELHPNAKDPMVLVLNAKPYTTVLPQGGIHVPADIWAPHKMGIQPIAQLRTLTVCAELLGTENVYYIED